MKEVTGIKYAESQGYVGDGDMFITILSFFKYAESETDNQKSKYLRRMNFFLERVLERIHESREIEFLVKSSARMKAVTNKIPVNLQWLTFDSQKEISLVEVIHEYNLSKKDLELLKALDYKSLDIRKALSIVDDLMDQVESDSL